VRKRCHFKVDKVELHFKDEAQLQGGDRTSPRFTVMAVFADQARNFAYFTRTGTAPDHTRLVNFVILAISCRAQQGVQGPARKRDGRPYSGKEGYSIVPEDLPMPVLDDDDVVNDNSPWGYRGPQQSAARSRRFGTRMLCARTA
jgi:hypothetical protein